MNNAYLGVEHSLTARRWVGPDVELDRQAEALLQSGDLPPALCQTLARLGVAPDEAARYLKPALRDLLPDPLSLRDMSAGVQRFVQAVQSNEKIAIFADYDVDGGASGALLVDWLRQMGCQTTLYVPDRIEEGYGPNTPAMAKLAHDHDLIICVDCGTLSHEPIAAAIGAEVIVLDHHQGGETLPPALAVINPNRQDENGDLGHLCAAGVVFLFLVEANRQLRDARQTLPDLMAMLDLVALATVADVAPLSGVNRAFVRQGLRVMAQRHRIGLRALADQAKVDGPPSTYSLGFVIGPRINAGGRIGAPHLGARLLATDDPHEAAALAERLDHLNGERRDVEEAVRHAAEEQVAARMVDAPLVWAAGEGWHPGVVGIVASRLKEAANRPAIVIGLDGDEGKGSGRSVAGVDLGAIIQRVTSEGLLLRGGGHKMAAGLTVARDQVETAMARIAELIARQPTDLSGPRRLQIDGTLMPGAATQELIEALERAGPFGAGAPAPRFVFPNQKITFAREVGQGHLKLRFGDERSSLDAIAFGCFNDPMGQELSQSGGRRFHLVGRLDINIWQGRKSVQLRLEDAAIAD